MAFNSFSFWIVFPFIFELYWLIPAKYNQWRKVFLILASYLLYMNWKPAFALVLLGVTLVTYFGGQVLEAQDETKKRKRKIAWLFALLGLLPLLTFKYYNFLNDSLTALLQVSGFKFQLPVLTGLCRWAFRSSHSRLWAICWMYITDEWRQKRTCWTMCCSWASSHRWLLALSVRQRTWCLR